jgi:hypothetical protein
LPDASAARDEKQATGQTLPAMALAMIQASNAASASPRAVASRYDKLAVRYQATINMAINQWLPRRL